LWADRRPEPLVDDSIVVVENIERWLREAIARKNSRTGHPTDRLAVLGCPLR